MWPVSFGGQEGLSICHIRARQCYPATKQNTTAAWFIRTGIAHATQACASGFCQRQCTCLCWSGHTSEPAMPVLSPISFQCSVKLTLATATSDHHIWHWRGWAEQSWCSQCHVPAGSWAFSRSTSPCYIPPYQVPPGDHLGISDL